MAAAPPPGTVRASLRFDDHAPDAALDPAAALGDLLGLLGRLDPARLAYAHLIDRSHIDIEIEVDFGQEGGDRVELVKLALIAAEGEAGFRAAFDAEAPGSEHQWLVATLGLADPVLGDAAIGLPLPLASMQALIGRQIRLSGAAYGYCLDCRRSRPTPDLARQLVRPLALVESAGARGARFTQPLREAVRLASAAGWRCAEGICLRSDASDTVAVVVETALIDWAIELYPFLPRDVCRVEWNPLPEATADPAVPEMSLQDAIGPLRNRPYALEAVHAALLAATRQAWSGAAPPPSAPAPAPVLPPPPDSPEGFAFLSYAHRDATWVTGLIEALGSQGVRIWYDVSIGGGERWDECLERRIRRCGLLIACLSPAYEASRYCRREIKFADHLEKPILPIASDAHAWGEGLAMMFQELQILDAAGAEGKQRLVRRIAHLAPACLTGAGA